MWNKNLPTKEGYYWVEERGCLTGKSYVHPVRIYSSKVGGTVDTVFSDGENFSINSDMFINWFSEQIAMPAKVFESKGDK
jgi:hypothetical protein